MSLFVATIELKPTEQELAIVRRHIEGDGGHQGLLRRALATLNEERGEWPIEDALLQKCYRYAYDYRDGGFQDRFRVIVTVARRAGWEPL